MMRTVQFLALALLLQTSTSWAQPVSRDGKEWLQPVDFTNLSWNDVNAVCPAGVCAGTLNGVDVTGYTWASVAGVNALFSEYGIVPPLPPTPTLYIELDSTFAPDFFADFTPSDVFRARLRAWSRDRASAPVGPVGAYAPLISDNDLPDADIIQSEYFQVKTTANAATGVWLWRSSTAAPTVATGLNIILIKAAMDKAANSK
jgi:hypothetical protein